MGAREVITCVIINKSEIRLSKLETRLSIRYNETLT